MRKLDIETIIERNKRVLKEGIRPIKFSSNKMDDSLADLIEKSEHVLNTSNKKKD